MTDSHNTWLTLPAPAKLNLMLHINGRREDGYHQLQTIFQFLDYGDSLSFQHRHDGELRLEPAIENVDFNDNLIIKAARILQQQPEAQGKSCGASINIHKILPMGGGLGGGSSNAATTLLALNKIWQLDLDLTRLAELGLVLGADVPVFIHGQSAWAQGVGEQLTFLPELPEKWFLIAHPNVHCNTAEIFSHKSLTRDTPIINIRPALEQHGVNDCQSTALMLYPEIGKTLNLLNKFGSAKMTGTGACLFMSFDSEKKASDTVSKLPADLNVFIAKGTNLSSAHKVLFGPV